MSRIDRRPLARQDLVEIWSYIAEDNDRAADSMLDRIEGILRMLADRPRAGRSPLELADNLRSFPIGAYVLFYLPLPDGIELVRILHGYRDIGHDDVSHDDVST